MRDAGIKISSVKTRRRIKELGFSCRTPTKKPFLKPYMVKKRLSWAKQHQFWTVDDWKNVRDLRGYLMENKNFNIIAYADDVVLMASTEDDLQRFLYHFVKNAEKYNMKVSTEKNKSMFSKESIRCKLEIEKKMIEQVMSFRCLGVDITSDRHIINEVRNQTQKAARISGCVRDVVWKNKYLNTESKIKIYKTAVRPILIYGTETIVETIKKTKQLMRTTEMNTLRTILGKTRLDKAKNETVRQECDIMDVIKFTKARRREWNFHVERAERNRLIRAARDFISHVRRTRGRPKKRWKEGYGLTHNQIDHILIDKRRHISIVDIRTFRGADCNSDHYLVIGELRERLLVAKQVEQQVNIRRFNIPKLKDEETKQHYQVEISNRFAVLASSDEVEEELDVDNMWENIRDNIKIVHTCGVTISESGHETRWPGFDSQLGQVTWLRFFPGFSLNPIRANAE
ncbi:hypothetical protein ANN_03329 [Periplaneta americana]|uniref:Reverse transcriptase domain-containing protein n=1 Tax=Periplaneta americana TaxID=6978 RepID=A0ABQ8U0E8_PERAM|nr:hypothetical protein ANN_03329 [Periplaneta americana]